MGSIALLVVMSQARAIEIIGSATLPTVLVRVSPVEKHDRQGGAHMKTKTCPDCNGDGVVDKGMDDEHQCPTCGGGVLYLMTTCAAMTYGFFRTIR